MRPPPHPAPHTGTVFSRVLPGEYIQAGQQGQLKMGQVEPPPELKVRMCGEGGTWRGTGLVHLIESCNAHGVFDLSAWVAHDRGPFLCTTWAQQWHKWC